MQKRSALRIHPRLGGTDPGLGEVHGVGDRVPKYDDVLPGDHPAGAVVRLRLEWSRGVPACPHEENGKRDGPRSCHDEDLGK